MNNPYRARPTRSRVDHAPVPSYGAQAQNTWGSMQPGTQPGLPTANTYSHQTPVIGQQQQQQQSQDPWDWGTDNTNNGNDSWNWNIDQQPDAQQQQQPHSQQFVPTFANNGQAVPSPIQSGSYYQNVNGNNRSAVFNQRPPSGRSTPRTSVTREPTPKLNETYNQYPPPGFNRQQQQQQQYSYPPRPNSKSSPALSDHSQWSNSQQSQGISPMQSKSSTLQKNPTPPPPLTNRHDWNNGEQQHNVAPRHNWQNHTDGPASGYWNDTNAGFNQQQNVAEQWQQQETQHSQAYAPEVEPIAPVGYERPMEWANPQQQNQWPSSRANVPEEEPVPPVVTQDSGIVTPNLWQPPVQTFQPPVEVKQSTSDQRQDNLPAHQWQQGPPQQENITNQWAEQATEMFEAPKDGAPPLSNQTLVSTNDTRNGGDWQQIQSQASHFASSLNSSTADSLSNHLETRTERKPMVNDSQLQATTEAPGDKKHWVSPSSEVNLVSNNSESVNFEGDWNADGEWNKAQTYELSSGFSQLSLSSKSDKPVENPTVQSDINSSAHSTDGWSSQTISGSHSDNALDNTMPENLPVFQPSLPVDSMEEVYARESQSVTMQSPPQEQAQPYHPAGVTRVQEHVAQVPGYDQWYSRNNGATQPENSWYPEDQQSQPKQWPAERNIENYENIQQSSEFVNLEVVAPVLQKRNIYGSHDSINRETLDNDPKPVASPPKSSASSRDFQQETNNVEVPTLQQQPQALQADQAPENYEFASNDRNTFLETGELTDSHQEHEPTPPSQDDENDEVPNDIPFLREVPGQSGNSDPRRNDPTGQEQYVQSGPRMSDPRRNDPSGQEQSVQPVRNIADRTERRDLPPGQERNNSSLPLRGDTEVLERRDDPSGRERSLPPQQSRNGPPGEERLQPQALVTPEPAETREVPGRGNESEEPTQQPDNGVRQIPGGASPNEEVQLADDRTDTRVVTGSQVAAAVASVGKQDVPTDSRSRREEAVGASIGENQGVPVQSNRRDSFEDGDDEGSGNSGEEPRDRNVDQRGFDYERKGRYYDRDRELDDDYYYSRRRGGEYDRQYNSREDLDRRERPYREDERRHASRDDLDRRTRDKDDRDRTFRGKEEPGDRDERRRGDERRRERPEDPRRREREFDSRYPREREYPERDRRRDERRGRRFDEYDPRDPRDPYRREYYEDPYARGSRPSSRSSYNDREREYYSRTREPFYGYNGYGGYDYGTNYNSNYYAYLENLRRTNPTAYAEWYHKYYGGQNPQQGSRGMTSYQDDRASVHSGRSSCDDRTNEDKRTLGDISLFDDTTKASARLTPTKYTTSHVHGNFSIGSLVHVHASYPADGEPARVDVLRVSNLLLHDPVMRELMAYPGPLIKQVGVTHKKTIIEYCEAKIKRADDNEDIDDPASYILLYQLMIMLIRQNGNVVGVDIAELLLSNKKSYPHTVGKRQEIQASRESVVSQRSEGTGGDENVGDDAITQEEDDNSKQKPLSVEQITDKFRELLLYGCEQEALEYAMTKGLWGHALFLASKLDKRTHASVMTRFANGLTANDPLQTLYQLHSGRVPASVTCVAEPKWGDWRPHLAMIISNTSPNPDVNRRSITTLGDTLATRGHIHAAHFCYILAQVDFGPYGAATGKLVLLGSNPHKPYADFVNNEAVMLTEIYEYARNLSEPGFTLVDLQTFKYELAVKMLDHGLTEKALLYIEQIAINISREPSKYKKNFIEKVYTLGDRIKYHDPVCKDSAEDAATLTWLNNLAEVVGKYQTGEISQERMHEADLHNVPQYQEHYETPQQPQLHSIENNSIAPPEYRDGPTSLMEVPTLEGQTDWQPNSLPADISQYPVYDLTSQNAVDTSQYQQPQQQQDYWGQQGYAKQEYGAQDYSQADWQQQSDQPQNQVEHSEIDSTAKQEEWNYESEKEEKPPTPEPPPTISMGPSGKQYDPLAELDALDAPKKSSKSGTDGKKSADKQPEKKATGGGGSWFGGLISKLALKPKNQMILPDDSNPKIVWDPVGNKWTNKDENGEGGSAPPAPPPTASEMGFRLPGTDTRMPVQPAQPIVQSDESTPIGNTPKPPIGNNMFKMPKGRSMRANYIDVMNPGGAKNGGTAQNSSTPVTSPPVPIAASSPQFFIPAPVNDPGAPVDFLTTTPVASGDNMQPGLSRWSSASSLSREVQSYTMRDPRLLQQDKGPMMFNPTDMKDATSKKISRSRYPPR